MYFKRKQSYKSVAGQIWQSQGSITAGYYVLDLELCRQSDMWKALDPAPVIRRTNYKYQPLVLQSRRSCITRVFFSFFFLSVTVVNCVIKPKSELSLISQRRKATKDLCVLFTTVHTDRHLQKSRAGWLLFEWHSQTVELKLQLSD